MNKNKPTEESELNSKEFLQEKGIHPTEPIYWDLGDTTISLNELMQEYSNTQNAELFKRYNSLNLSCPCKLADESCTPDCTCKNGGSSRGCFMCNRYGGEEQRKEIANIMLNDFRKNAELQKEVERLKDFANKISSALATYGSHPLFESWLIKLMINNN
jgi:hypothetical protein